MWSLYKSSLKIHYGSKTAIAACTEKVCKGVGSETRAKSSPKGSSDRGCFTLLDSWFWFKHNVTTDAHPIALPSQGCYIPRERNRTLGCRQRLPGASCAVPWWKSHSTIISLVNVEPDLTCDGNILKLCQGQGVTWPERVSPRLPKGFPAISSTFCELLTWAVGKLSLRREHTSLWNPIPVVASYPRPKCNSRVDTIQCHQLLMLKSPTRQQLPKHNETSCPTPGCYLDTTVLRNLLIMNLLLLKPLDFECSSFSLATGKQENLPFFPLFYSFQEGNVPALHIIYCIRYPGNQQADLQ